MVPVFGHGPDGILARGGPRARAVEFARRDEAMSQEGWNRSSSFEDKKLPGRQLQLGDGWAFVGTSSRPRGSQSDPSSFTLSAGAS
eukprot:4467661-Alexandrium_andersonii.AAC.1